MNYGYAKTRLATAEDFIQITATESSVTGKPYVVRCDGEDLPSAQWLQGELIRYRVRLSTLNQAP